LFTRFDFHLITFLPQKNGVAKVLLKRQKQELLSFSTKVDVNKNVDIPPSGGNNMLFRWYIYAQICIVPSHIIQE